MSEKTVDLTKTILEEKQKAVENVNFWNGYRAAFDMLLEQVKPKENDGEEDKEKAG